MELWEQTIEEARKQFPEIVEEYERLAEWVSVCVGSDIAAKGGRSVN